MASIDNENAKMEFRILVGTIDYDQYGERVINGIEFGNSDEQIAISTVSGLETPPIRNNTGDWSGRDGGYMSSQLYSARTITITGFYWDKDYACGPGTETREDIPYTTRERLANYLKIREKYPIFIKFMGNKVMFAEGFMIDFKMDYEFVKSGRYQVTFYCPEYALSVAEEYGDPNSIWRRAELHKEIFGGHLVPEEIDVLFKEGRHPTVINYEGLIPHWPTITLKGPATNPTFLNTATNKYFRVGTPTDLDDYPTYTEGDSYAKGDKVGYNGTLYEAKVDIPSAPAVWDSGSWTNAENNFSIVAGQTLTIDMGNRQALVNGKSVSMSIDPNSEWWYLVPGENRIYMLTHNGSDSDTAEITWTTDYQGV